MNFLLALLSASAHSMGNVSTRIYQTKYQRTMADFRLIQTLSSMTIAFLNLVLAGFMLSLDRMGLLLGLCYGVDLMATGVLVATCFECGPMSVTSVITNACVVLPIVVGCIWYDEVMSGTQILGCALLAVTFVLSAINPQKEKTVKKEIQPKWYLLVFLAFFCNGMGAVLLNIYGRVAAAEQRNTFLALGYFIAALGYLVSHLRMVRKYGPVEKTCILNPVVPVLILIGAMGGFIGNGILMSLNTSMPASVLYPLVNGGIAVIVAILSCVVFKEKLTLQRALTILVGLGAIITLNL